LRLGAIAIGLLSFVAGCQAALAQQPECTGNQKPWVVAELLFGLDRVNERSWSRFLATEITPRFPDGLTVYDAKGQWRAPSRAAITRQRSKVVMIAMPPAADNTTRLQQIIESYKTRFRQQSVGLIMHPACVSF
jgi:hypothetical protein